ncbi:MAG: DUF2007 domain-containing protein [Alphaproteobacteria bacterium]
MRELLRTTDLVRLSWLMALLADAGIEAVVLDTHTSVLEGSVNAIPRRLVVDEDDYSRARYVLGQAGESLPDD